MQGRFLKTRRIAILIIAGFLIILHIAGLTDLYTSKPISSYSAYVNLQSMISVFIIASLLFTIIGKRMGLVGMWVSITALILTQYWAHFGFHDADFTEGRSAFSYLRGFMFPAAVTFLFLYSGPAKKSVATE